MADEVAAGVPKKTPKKKAKRTPAGSGGLDKDRLIQAYQTMILSRRLDEKMLALLKQGKSFFHIGGPGHEAVQVACAMALTPGKDWAYPYYRDLAFVLGLGVTPTESLLCFLARAEDPSSGGRQMPAHYGHRELRIVSQSSPTGPQFLQAVGCGFGCQRDDTDEVVYCSAGEGTTSQGDFHEALNWASRAGAPVVFVIEDNKFAISVPIAQQTSGGSVYEIASGYTGLERVQIDGTDFFQSYRAAEMAVARARAGDGPTLIVADVVRLLAHSSSDDQRKYRKPEDLAHDRERDPIPKLEQILIDEGMLSSEEVERLRAEVKKTVDDSADDAESRPMPADDTATLYVYSPDRSPVAGNQNFRFEASEPSGEPVVMVDAINHALHEEMERNDRMLVFGQDIEDDKGGVFTATRGLTRAFGKKRAFNAPLAESSIAGVAVGLATRGFKPVAEIQFGDYIWTGMMQIRNELATMRYRSNDKWSCPAVIRVPVGGYIHGGLYHSQSIEGFFSHLPGIRIALPSNAADAKGLLKSAIRGDDPVLFMEHKALYRQGYAKSPEPDADYLLPFGKGVVRREGTDLSIITYGAMVYRSLEAARTLEDEEGLSIEVVDIRTINPLDTDLILDSVRKTNRVLIVYEDTQTAGFGAEIAARIADLGFEQLDAPIRRVAAKDAFIPFNWDLEAKILPQTGDIVKATRELAAY